MFCNPTKTYFISGHCPICCLLRVSSLSLILHPPSSTKCVTSKGPMHIYTLGLKAFGTASRYHSANWWPLSNWRKAFPGENKNLKKLLFSPSCYHASTYPGIKFRSQDVLLLWDSLEGDCVHVQIGATKLVQKVHPEDVAPCVVGETSLECPAI